MVNPTKTDSSTREHEHVLEIEASPDQVWRAITEPRLLANWFALEAEVQPGEGGRIIYRWDDLEGVCEVQVWEPGLHLKTGWLEPLSEDPERGSQLSVDWYLEGKEGRTRLRLVHSGFGPEAAWDEEYDGTRRGWTFELQSLRHYLERHPAATRSAFWVRRSVQGDLVEGWSRLIAADGFLRSEGLDTASPGRQVHLDLASGDQLQATVLTASPSREISFRVPTWNDGLLRVGVEQFSGRTTAIVWVSLWDCPEGSAIALRDRIEASLDPLAT